MNTNRIQATFEENKKANRKCVMPYVTAGFPDTTTTIALLKRCADAGAPIIEVGIPFSDSIADGPVIQDSFWRALQRGFRVEPCLQQIGEARSSINAALVAMVSYTLVFRYGPEKFFADLSRFGFDGVILPDVPVEEVATISAQVTAAGLMCIGLIAPTTSGARRHAIIQSTSGFLYQIARAGITGERAALAASLRDDVARLQSESSLPICVGFGISTPEHVTEVCQFADGAIVGSAIVRRMMEADAVGKDQVTMVAEVGNFVDQLVAAGQSGP
ncbi:MAG: tryptophan synthase subunit alpha [Phycisphaerae bacterium]